MNENIRPFTLGEILDRTAQLYRRNFLLFAGVASLPIGVMIAIAVLAGAFGAAAFAAARGVSGSNVLMGLALVALLVLAIPVYIAAYVYSTAGLTQTAINTHRGHKLTIRATLSSIRPRFWSYLGFLLLQGIVVAAVPLAAAAGVASVLIYAVTRLGGGVAAGVATGFVVFVVIGAAVVIVIWLALSYSMGMAVSVVEQKTAWDSMTRAWRLSQGTRGRIFVLFLLVIALTMVVSMIAYIPFLIIAGVVTASANGAQSASIAMVIAEIANVIVNFTLQTLLMPITWIALVLFYYDQRVRKEGFDIEWMMEQAGLVQPQPIAGLVPSLHDPGLAQLASAPPVESGTISGPTLPPDTVEER
jgi:hypothetical protein